jgi:outer membrane protein TolC
MNYLRIISFVIALLPIMNAEAQTSLTLSDAIRIGLENNYDLQIVRKNEDIAKINNTWGNTSIMPSVNFSLSGRENYNINDNDNYRLQTINPDLSLNWMIFNGFAARINKQRFEELEEQSEGNTTILVESTIQDIILAYNNCLLQNEMVAVFKKLADLSEDRYNRTMDSKDLGVSTTYDGLQAKTSMLEDQSNYLQQKVTFDNAVRTLNYTLAMEVNTLWSFTTELELVTPEYTIESLSSRLLENNSTIKNQYIYQSLMAKQTALAKSAFSPTLSLNTGIGNTDFGQFYKGNTQDMQQNYSDAYVGLTFSWSIFNGGTKKRSVEIAKINEETLQVETTKMEQSLSNQLMQMFYNYEVQKDILKLSIEQEASAKLNLDLSADKLANGTINSFNYRDVQAMYLNAAIAKYKAIYNVVQSNTDLLRITGGIISQYK